MFAGKLKQGEERALTTRRRQPGFRELLGEEHQDKELNADERRWENRPQRGSLTRNHLHLHDPVYRSGRHESSATVTLTPEARREHGAKRWRRTFWHAPDILPDVSVEQMFLAGEERPPNGQEPLLHDPHHGETARSGPREPRSTACAMIRARRSWQARPSTSSRDQGRATAIMIRFSEPTSEATSANCLDREFRKNAAYADRETFKLTPLGRGQRRPLQANEHQRCRESDLWQTQPGEATRK